MGDALKATGFEVFSEIGEFPWTPLVARVYVRADSPRFLIDIGFDRSEHVYAEDVADVMDLLSRWAPALQAAAVVEVSKQLNEPAGPQRPGGRRFALPGLIDLGREILRET